MLRFAEEIMLLILDDGGEFARVPRWSLHCALAGGVLMDLALEGRIDTDPERLFVVDPAPVGDDLLDPVLAQIAETPETFDARYWVQTTAEGAERIRVRSLERLVEQGILEFRDQRFMWVLRSRRYPTIDGKADREVKLRIMSVLFSDEIPDPRDSAIVGLADTCGISKQLLSKRELEGASERIALASRLDLMLRAVSWAVQDRRTPPAKRVAIAVGADSELPPLGGLASVSHDGKEYVIANVDGRYYAVDGRCEHAGARLVRGHLDDCRLTCPAHGWTYDVTDGSIVKPPLERRRLRSYAVRVKGGTIELAPAT
ncbi:MAG: GPP34 family phosphoprotein [Rhodospirillaceae bacterium]|nr:GPP34 family phosphoprotein [Rhodospirillaceae bacterium]